MKILFKSTSYRKGAALSVGATAVWKVLSFINALLIAAYFGAGAETDLYFYLLLTIGLGVYFLQRMNAAVIIPEAMTRQARSPGSDRPLLNFFFYFYVALLLLLTAAAFIGPVQLGRAFSRFCTADLVAQRTLLVLGFILLGLQLLASYLQAILEMYRRFTSVLFSPLNALLPLGCLLIFGREIGIASMLYGFIASYLLQSILFIGWMKWELNWSFGPQKSTIGTNFLHNLGSNQLMELANLISQLLPLYLLSGLPAGLVSALNYAKQLSESTSEVFTLRVSIIAKIELTEYAARAQKERLHHSYLNTHRFRCFLLTPLTVFSIFYAPSIISIFFQRGQFTPQDAVQAARFLRPLLIIMLLMVPVLMQNCVVAAQRKLKEFLPYALLGSGIFILSVGPAIKWAGPFAYPYTQVSCMVIGFGINAIFFRKIGFTAFGPSLREMGRLVLWNLFALVPAALYAYYVTANPWLTVLGGGVIFLAAWGSIFYSRGDLTWFFAYFKRPKAPQAAPPTGVGNSPLQTKVK